MQEQGYRESADRRDSARSLLATPKNIADAGAWLMLDEEQEETFSRCLRDEPLKRLLSIVDWLAAHEVDPDYDPSAMIVGWAKLRGAGCFRPQGLRTEQCVACSDKYPVAQIVEVEEDNLTFHEGDTLCRGCARRHGVR
jgi:hypothetical protein